MKIYTIYAADDGTEFGTLEECQDYEKANPLDFSNIFFFDSEFKELHYKDVWEFSQSYLHCELKYILLKNTSKKDVYSLKNKSNLLMEEFIEGYLEDCGDIDIYCDVLEVDNEGELVSYQLSMQKWRDKIKNIFNHS